MFADKIKYSILSFYRIWYVQMILTIMNVKLIIIIGLRITKNYYGNIQYSSVMRVIDPS